MSFRDFNRRTAPRKVYTGGMSFRDMKDVPESAAESEQLPEVPEKPPFSQNIITNVPPMQNNVVYSQTIQPNISVQAGYTNLSRYPKSVYIQQPPPVRSQSIPQSVHLKQPQSQFIYYNQSPAPPPAQPTQNFIPPPPETPDPSKFVEEYVPTPPPKMVRAKIPAVRKIPDNFDKSTGAFGGTFDGNPDQSTPVAELPDIPVMDNINDFKI